MGQKVYDNDLITAYMITASVMKELMKWLEEFYNVK